MTQDPTIEFGERRRTLRFDIDAMIALEGVLDGKSSGEIVGNLVRWSLTTLVCVLWAGLKHEDDKLSVSGVQKMLGRYVTQDGANLRQLRDACRRAIQDAQWYQQAISSDDAEGAADDAGNA